MITWQTPAGSLGIVTERILREIPLEATSDVGPITFTLIAGSLPRGLRLTSDYTYDSTQTNGYIKGAPVEVRRYTESRFVIRADDGEDIEDRTFSIGVDGADIPAWVTSEGFLNVGEGNSYFVLDNSYVDFQLEATDSDKTAGDILEYYLMPIGGVLPPGLSLSRSGRISGFTDPIFALEYNGFPNGGYDTSPMDVTPLDFVEAKSNGFDSYYFDNVTYDYSENSRVPRRLSRIYTFAVATSDGRNSVSRVFKIFVVTEEFLQADNSIVQVDTNLFQADSASARKPLWITESNLGRFRANNYVTIFLDVYDPPTLSGTITYFLLPTNPGYYKLKETGQTVKGNYELSNSLPVFKYTNLGIWNSITTYDAGNFVSVSTKVGPKIITVYWVCKRSNKNILPVEGQYWTKENISTSTQSFTLSDTTLWETVSPETTSSLPPGMELDSITGDITGRVPYQAAVTKTYNFTMMAVNFPATLATTTYTLTGDWNAYITYAVNDAVRYLGFIYTATAANKNKIPSDDSDFWFKGVSTADKTFTVDIIGEIESSVNWLVDSDRGTIKPNQPSQLFIKAESLLYGGRIAYEFVSGSLPPGLTFLSTGDIDGKVRQSADEDDKGNPRPGLTRFYERTDSLTVEDSSTLSRSFTDIFDGGATTFDKKFTFTIKARDAANFVESLKTFYITVISDNTQLFANLYVHAFQTKSKRLAWYNFITDATIFKPSEIYRYGDINFGIQTELKMLVFAGIESVDAVRYVQAMSRNHNNKRLLFGDIKVAEGKDPVTQETIYEVIYVDVIDEFEKNGKSINSTVQLPDNINSKVLLSYDKISVDSDIPFVSDSDHQRVFPNSIKNMRNRIKVLGDRDRDFLPLWMRSIQGQTTQESGFVKALVLCYTVPGKSANVLARINAAEFDFKTIDFTADRYLIDILDGQIEAKYLAFPQRGEKLP